VKPKSQQKQKETGDKDVVDKSYRQRTVEGNAIERDAVKAAAADTRTHAQNTYRLTHLLPRCANENKNAAIFRTTIGLPMRSACTYVSKLLHTGMIQHTHEWAIRGQHKLLKEPRNKRQKAHTQP
jgi:hypothetical protein